MCSAGGTDGLSMSASLNERSEGHSLELDQLFGDGWLEAPKAALQ